MDLAEFLQTRLDEDEATATGLTDDQPVPALWNGDDGLLIAPSRVLAEVEAKRRIIERVEAIASTLEATGQVIPRDIAMLIDGILLDLAQPYADHPAYRQEWRL